MTHEAEPSDAARGLTLALDALRSRRRLLRRLLRLWRGLWQWTAAWVAIVLLDALLPLPAMARCALAVGLGAGFVVVLFRLRLGRYDPTLARLREARALETHLQLQRNEVVSGVQLASLTGTERDSLVAELAGRAVRRAGGLTQGIEPVTVLSGRAGQRQLLILLGLWLAMLLSLAWDSDWLVGGTARLVDPWGDHPPFSFTKFHPRADPANPVVGSDVTVRAMLRGWRPEGAQLVMLDAQGNEVSRWPMVGVTAGKPGDEVPPGRLWERRLRSVRQPVTMRVQVSERSYSKRFTITPIPPEVPPESPPETHQASKGKSETPASQPMMEVSPSDAATLAMMQELAEQARLLEELSRQLAGRLQALEAQEQLPEWLQGELDDLDDRLQSFNQRSELLKRILGRRGSQRDWLQEIMSQCQGALHALECNKIGNKPGRGKGLMGQGAGGASGVRGWTAQVARASAHDARMLNQQAGKMGRILIPLPGGGATPQPGMGTPPLRDPRATGVTVETGGVGARVDSSQAWMSRVPPAYRDLVARYFQTIAQDREPQP